MNQSQFSLCLEQICAGDKSAVNRLLPHIYDDLRVLADRMLRGTNQPTLQPTVLVHDAYMRLAKTDSTDWEGRNHFMAVAAMAMRQLLTDYARKRRCQKRGGDRERVSLDQVAAETTDQIDLLALDEALTDLEKLDPRQARVVELRFLAGLTIEETAKVLGIAPRTVNLDWQMARSWMELRIAGSS